MVSSGSSSAYQRPWVLLLFSLANHPTLIIFFSRITTNIRNDNSRINNKSGPHNIVFDEDAIPAGVDVEAISMDDQLGEEGDTFTMKFDKAGTYEYYCEPHRGTGMIGTIVVS